MRISCHDVFIAENGLAVFVDREKEDERILLKKGWIILSQDKYKSYMTKGE